MIDKNKWISTLPNTGNKFSEEINQIDHSIWTNTISKKKKSSSIKKYSFVVALFVSGLLLVSTVKNETRNLQKEINNLQAFINYLEVDLHKATLDYEVITSPENISQLAKKYLDTELAYYKKSQIKKLHEKAENPTSLGVIKTSKTKSKIKFKVVQKIEEKKIELQKLKELYQQPEKIPGEIKISLARKIEEKKIQLKELYQNPKQSIDIKKIQRWGAFQLVKVFLGVPVIPGR